MGLLYRMFAPLWRIGEAKYNFFSAIHHKDTEWFKRIIVERPEYAKVTDIMGVKVSLLIFVVSGGGTAEMVDILIAYGADVNCTDGDGETALDVAIKNRNKNRNEAVIGALHAHGGKTAAELADGARPSSAPATIEKEFLMGIFSRSKPGSHGNTPTREEEVQQFVSALRKGNTKWLERFLEENPDFGSDIKFNGCRINLLHLLALSGTSGAPAMVQMLLDRGEDPNGPAENGLLPLDYALVVGNVEVALILRKHGAKESEIVLSQEPTAPLPQEVRRETYPDQPATADYSFVMTEPGGRITGVWVRSMEVISGSKLHFLLLKHGAPEDLRMKAVMKAYRVVPNNYDAAGGYFIMFCGEYAPGE